MTPPHKGRTPQIQVATWKNIVYRSTASTTFFHMATRWLYSTGALILPMKLCSLHSFWNSSCFSWRSIPPEKTHQTLKWCGRWLGSHSVFGILGVIVTTRLSRHHPIFFLASAQLQSFEIPNTREPVTFWEKKSYCMHSVVNKIEKGGGGRSLLVFDPITCWMRI